MAGSSHSNNSTRRLKPKYWLTWLGITIVRFISHLPYRAAMACGRVIGRVAKPLLKKRAHIARVNLQLCFPKQSSSDREALLNKHFDSLGMGAIELGMAWWSSDKRLKPLAHFKGLEHLENALAEKRGVILLGSHSTCLDLVGRLYAQISDDLCVMYRQSHDPVIDYLLETNRKKFFYKAVERHDLRQAIRLLKDNRLLWYAPDQDYGLKHGIFAPLFGISAATITMTARLCKLTKAAVVPSFYYRLPNQQGYQIEILPALRNFPSGDELTDATRVNKIIEQAITKYPEQYYWVHRRFKTRPEGEHSPY